MVTVFGPGDFPLGSPESRMAARIRLQRIGVAGERPSVSVMGMLRQQCHTMTNCGLDSKNGVLDESASECFCSMEFWHLSWLAA